MTHEFVLPLMGEGVVEAQIGRWLINVGDTVSEGDPLVEVETDKVTTELEAEYAGEVVEILVPEGETAVLHQPLARINPTNGAAPIPPNPQPAAAPKVANGTTPHEIRVSPVVRRMVAEHNIDLAQVTGTGKNGRITKDDILNHLNLSTETAVPPIAPTPVRPPEPTPLPQDGDLQPISNMRRKIAEHMVMSKRESPHATTVFEIDFHAVAQHRAQTKADFANRGVKLTYMAYIATAVTRALQAVPTANAQWRSDGVLYHRQVHLGMATAVNNGLVVPVIKQADGLNLFGMASAIEQLAQKARSGQLKTEDLQGGTFTITNHGVFGSLFATPIINQPQAGILGVGTIEKRVCVVDEMIAIRPKSFFSFSFDHRLLDGADADRFMQVIKETLEGWEKAA